MIVWDEHNIGELINQEMYDNARTESEQSDIVRIEKLREFGGVYVDCDVECYRNIEPVIGNCSMFVCQDREIWNDQYKIPYLNGALMGCTPDHPLINKLIGCLPSFAEEHADDHVYIRTGPGFITLTLAGEDFFVPPVEAFNGDFCRHHFANSWLEVEPYP
ncbi:MAG: Capsular polysaccharide synthesis protein [Candidatus Methanofastidiosum methylothiophilum]|uniref:Capsular polysaccharide synthesis protein n=1 Tax=Candidatus Methanofastidiosum methylothiophilum TaxID=1705564 RepID=A0A150IPA7_9EURY|nr:MAG: Capsular polysaccharide synthesis protein [Candidatus Methanofastidiosum methylthiophilus]